MAEGAEQLRAEAGRLAEDPKVRGAADEARRHAKDAGKAIRDAATDAGKIIRDAAGPAGKKAEKVFDEAASYVGSAAKVAGGGFKATRASAAATAGIMKAKDWVKENPGKAAVVSASLILGIRGGGVSGIGSGSSGYASALVDTLGAAGLGIEKGEREI